MRAQIMIAVLVPAAMLFTILCYGQSVPASTLPVICEAIRRDFSAIDAIYTIGMSDDPNGRFDIIVVGGRRGRDDWRVEVLSVNHRRLTKIWDSAVSLREPEFESSGSDNVSIIRKEKDYDLMITGCALHQCGDGVTGYLVFSGKTGTTFKAKVDSQEGEHGFTYTPKYIVTFSKDITDDAKKTLKDAICAANANVITYKKGLPFECKNP